MNTLLIPLAWCFLQVTLLCLVGCAVYLVARRFSPQLGRTTIAALLGFGDAAVAGRVQPLAQLA